MRIQNIRARRLEIGLYLPETKGRAQRDRK
jgi:hypothetical protein